MNRRATALLGAVLSLAGLTGCSVIALAGALPGGPPTGPAYRVDVEFADVLDLVPRSAVKVNDVTVGDVDSIELHGWVAVVHLRVDRTAHLPANASAAIRQTSLLGEKFVSLSGPVGEAPQGQLADGDLIPLIRTRRDAEVEEVLGALGLVLNGGGLAQLKTISHELGLALQGSQDEARAVVGQLDVLIGGLDAQRADIVRAIDALDRLSARLSAQRDTIGAAVDALGPGLRALADERDNLTAALDSLAALGVSGTRVINASRGDLLASIAALRPILDRLVAAGDALPRSLDYLLSFPFPPNVAGAVVGSTVNLHVTLDLDAMSVLANLTAAGPGAGPGQPLPWVPVPTPIPLPSLPVPLPSLSLPVPSVSVPGVPLPSLPLPSLSVPGLPLPSLAPPAQPLRLIDVLSGGLRP
jgi:phospholipid/cholesterol/gamma-HCH transport system substrate-binding protein